jgi:hypothetical protein
MFRFRSWQVKWIASEKAKFFAVTTAMEIGSGAVTLSS